MSKNKNYLYPTLRLSVTLMTVGAFLFNTFASAITPAEANPMDEAIHSEPAEVTPGLQTAIEDALGLEAYAPAIQDAKLTPSDGASADKFGVSVALSGDTALVGALGDEDNGFASGSAYLFERDQGGADNWGQVKKITASDGAANDLFGNSVALSGDTALVGAYHDNDNGSHSGSAYIFERDQGGAGNWGEVKKITASDGALDDSFGYFVALSGDTALVGAEGDDDNGSHSGSAYIFERGQGGAGNWGEVKKITASDAAANDFFGWSVALSGDTALVGAWGDSDSGSNSGSAYFFKRDQGGAGNWGQAKKITASDAASGDWFGYSVALSGDTALVGAYVDDDAGNASGSAYIFDRNQGGAGNWGEVKKITASDGAAYDYFGWFVALSGDTALVGAYGDDDNGSDSGSAYIFDRDQGGTDNWGEVSKLTALDGAADDYFSNAAALDGDTALVGAKYDDDNGEDSGSAYIYLPYLTNGGFEKALGAGWTEAVTGNGDGRLKFNHAVEGNYIYLFRADGGVEFIRQVVSQSGSARDQYTLTLYFGGKDVNLSGKLGVRLIFTNGGVTVDKKTCVFTPRTASFSWTSFTCTLTATGVFDSIVVLIGIQNVPSGLVGVDAAVLNKTGP